jgi:hypothetical protein
MEISLSFLKKFIIPTAENANGRPRRAAAMGCPRQKSSPTFLEKLFSTRVIFLAEIVVW